MVYLSFFDSRNVQHRRNIVKIQKYLSDPKLLDLAFVMVDVNPKAVLPSKWCPDCMSGGVYLHNPDWLNENTLLYKTRNEWGNYFLIGKNGNFALSYQLDPDNDNFVKFVTAELAKERVKKKASDYKSQMLIGLVLLLLLGLIVVLINRYRLGQVNKKAQLQKRIADLELIAIQSQINPHFIFNALNSVQSLLRSHEIEKANQYIVDFAQLLRNTIDTSNQQWISIKDETRILQTYLSLEQLRLTFEFSIDVDERLDVFTTEIPTMLLQPIVENSLKHGLRRLKKHCMSGAFCQYFNLLVT